MVTARRHPQKSPNSCAIVLTDGEATRSPFDGVARWRRFPTTQDLARDPSRLTRGADSHPLLRSVSQLDPAASRPAWRCRSRDGARATAGLDPAGSSCGNAGKQRMAGLGDSPHYVILCVGSALNRKSEGAFARSNLAGLRSGSEARSHRLGARNAARSLHQSGHARGTDGRARCERHTSI
jgi:hypothetical protein